jgi:hypothetical protein
MEFMGEGALLIILCVLLALLLLAILGAAQRIVDALDNLDRSVSGVELMKEDIRDLRDAVISLEIGLVPPDLIGKAPVYLYGPKNAVDSERFRRHMERERAKPKGNIEYDSMEKKA